MTSDSRFRFGKGGLLEKVFLFRKVRFLEMPISVFLEILESSKSVEKKKQRPTMF